MNNPPKSPQNFERILAAIEAFRSHDRKLSGMIYTDNWYDSHPRMLILDPVLNPYDKVVWLVIRSRCSPGMSLTAFPTYDEIQSSLHISRGAVATSITKLRLTRWVTLLRRERVRNTSGQFTKDGNIYMIHGEPVSLSDTFDLDANYMAFTHQCASHRNTEVRKVAATIRTTFKFELDCGVDPLRDQHPLDRRMEAWRNRDGDQESQFYSYHPKAIEHTDSPSNTSETQPNSKFSSRDAPVVHDVNHGAQSSAVHTKNQVSSVERSAYVSSNIKNNNYLQPNSSSSELGNLQYPETLSSNQRYLVQIRLSRLPDTLPDPPAPWENWEQALLDELSGRMQAGVCGDYEPVKNPVSLISTYCKRLTENGYGLKEEGNFQIELAEAVHRKRFKRARSIKAYEAAKKSHRQRVAQDIRDRRK